MAEYKLSQEIIALSDATTWDDAKQEWDLDEIYKASRGNPETCLCGHYPILEVCIIRNLKNGETAVVGNCCVKKFMKEPNRIFRALDRIEEDYENPLNADAVHYAYDKEWIDDWQKEFYIDTWRKRKLSEKQMTKRSEINLQIMKRYDMKRSSL